MHLRFYKRLQLYLPVDGFDNIFDVAAILLLFQIFGLFQNKFIKACARKFSSLFAPTKAL